MEKKLYFVLVFLLLAMPLTSAVPALIRSNININIVNGQLQVSNDGVTVISEFIVNMSSNFTKTAESVIIREMGNATDLAQLVNELHTYNTDCTTTKILAFEACKDQLRELNTSCDFGYKQMYDTCNSDKATAINNYNQANNNKIMWLIGGIVIGALACYLIYSRSGRIVIPPNEQRSSFPDTFRH